jgi:hypothetical protein
MTFYEDLDNLEGDLVVVVDEIDMLGADNDKHLDKFPLAKKMGSLEDTHIEGRERPVCPSSIR